MTGFAYLWTQYFVQEGVIMTEKTMIMRHTFTHFVLMAVALLAASCSKDAIPDTISPEELFGNEAKIAKTTIHTKSDEFEDTVTTFPRVQVTRRSDIEGQSWLCAWSGGRMVYDMFMLSIYFDSIDKMKVGEELKTSRFMFSFVASSDSRATTHEYGGKITLADKGDDYVILHFKNVSFSCSFGDYLTDGYLYCPLYDAPVFD